MTNLIRLVLAKNDAEFDAKRESMISELKTIGLDKSVEFWSKAYNDARDKIDSIGK